MRTQTTNTGNFIITLVPAGVYNVTVGMGGLRKFEQQGIPVQVARPTAIRGRAWASMPQKR